MFTQLLGGAIFTSVASNVLSNELLRNLAAVPGVDPGAVLGAGATSLLAGVPAGAVPAVLVAYNAALRTVFRAGLAMSCLVIFGTAAMEWRSVKSKKTAAAAGNRENKEAGGSLDVEAAAAAAGEKKAAVKEEGEDTQSVETATADHHHNNHEHRDGASMTGGDSDKIEAPTSK